MKIIKKLFIGFICSVFSMLSVSAHELYDINMVVTLNNDGSAHFVETWTMKTETDNFTEFYKSYGTFRNEKIVNFKVKDENREYTFISDWNINGSFSSKQYKNGFNYTDEGTELCWGISDYGNKVYTLEYDIQNLIFNTQDAQVFYMQLIVPNAFSKATSFNITVKGPYEYPDTLDVWAYGAKAYAYVYDGVISSSNTEDKKLGKDDYLVLLIKFPLSTFITENEYDEYNDFESVFDRAEEGKFAHDYGKKSVKTIVDFIVVLLPYIGVIITLIFVIVGSGSKYKFGTAGNKVNMKEINMFRDIPCKKDVFRAYFIAKAYKLNNKDTDFLGTLLLKWLNEDIIKIQKENVKKLFGTKEVTSIEFKENRFEVSVEQEMHDMMMKSSGDGILQSDEFEKYATKNYSKVLSWFDDVEVYGRNLYEKEGLVNKDKGKYLINDLVKQDAIELAGLKKYLLHFASMNEKEAIEVKLWKEYLMYAQIFGIANKVAKQFERLYPEVIEQLSNENFTISDMMLLNNFSNNVVSAASTARSRAESYSSGGGGFSSGGGGGGSFGGGGSAGGR